MHRSRLSISAAGAVVVLGQVLDLMLLHPSTTSLGLNEYYRLVDLGELAVIAAVASLLSLALIRVCSAWFTGSEVKKMIVAAALLGGIQSIFMVAMVMRAFAELAIDDVYPGGFATGNDGAFLITCWSAFLPPAAGIAAAARYLVLRGSAPSRTTVEQPS